LIDKYKAPNVPIAQLDRAVNYGTLGSTRIVLTMRH